MAVRNMRIDKHTSTQEHRETWAQQPSGLHRDAGFTLVELMIVVAVLGILAAIVIPEFSGHIQQAKEAAAKDNLRILRETIERYDAKHGVPPGYSNNDPTTTPNSLQFVMQLIDDRYLTEIPSNPLNNKNSVYIIGNGSPFPDTPPGLALLKGWVYQPETKEIRLSSEETDLSGTPYFDY